MISAEKCAAVGCPNRTDENSSKEISFHSFPSDIVKKAEWLVALNRFNWKPTTQSVLCSEHFRPEDLDKTSPNVRVQQYAIPLIFPHQSASNQKEDSKIEQPSQKKLRSSNKCDNELKEFNHKVKDTCTQPSVEVGPENVQTSIDNSKNTSLANRKRKRSNSKKKVSLKMNNNSQIVTKPKPCVTTPTVDLPSNSKKNIELKPKPKRRSRKRKPVPEDSKPTDTNQNQQRSLPFKNRKKLYHSLMIVAKPYLEKTEFTKSERVQLDTFVKTLLSYAPKEFTEWLFKQRLLKSTTQMCKFHPLVQLELALCIDGTSFPCSGGYVWFRECCPDEIVSVYNGSFFESLSFPPSEILKLIYCWSCQMNFKDVVQLVKVDYSHIRLVNSRLRAICTIAVQTDVSLLGGPGKKVEIGMLMISLLSNSNENVGVAVLGVLESETKQIHLRVLKLHSNNLSNCKPPMEEILSFLSYWIHPGSVIVINTALNKNVLFEGGFRNIQQSTDQNCCDESTIMKYLNEIIPGIFGKMISLMKIDVVQKIFDELVWRERYGTTPSECFSNIMIHIAQQTNRFTNLIRRLADVSQNPLTNNWRA